MRSLLLCSLLTAAWLVTPNVASEPDCCARCGCHCRVKKVCRLVPDKKKVTEVEFDCKCEDFCTPGPSKLCGEKCHCDCKSPRGHTCEKIWQPSCGCVRTRHVLMKREVTKEVPSYKCVVEYVCERCCDDGDCAPSLLRKPLFLGLFHHD